MTSEFNKRFFINKDFKVESANTSNSVKSTWKTEKRISSDERIVLTPSGRFIVTEKNGPLFD